MHVQIQVLIYWWKIWVGHQSIVFAKKGAETPLRGAIIAALGSDFTCICCRSQIKHTLLSQNTFTTRHSITATHATALSQHSLHTLDKQCYHHHSSEHRHSHPFLQLFLFIYIWYWLLQNDFPALHQLHCNVTIACFWLLVCCLHCMDPALIFP
jgi:hypothetical protein